MHSYFCPCQSHHFVMMGPTFVWEDMVSVLIMWSESWDTNTSAWVPLGHGVKELEFQPWPWPHASTSAQSRGLKEVHLITWGMQLHWRFYFKKMKLCPNFCGLWWLWPISQIAPPSGHADQGVFAIGNLEPFNTCRPAQPHAGEKGPDHRLHNRTGQTHRLGQLLAICF